LVGWLVALRCVALRCRGKLYEHLLYLSKVLVSALGGEEWSYYDGSWEVLTEA